MVDIDIKTNDCQSNGKGIITTKEQFKDLFKNLNKSKMALLFYFGNR